MNGFIGNYLFLVLIRRSSNFCPSASLVFYSRCSSAFNFVFERYLHSSVIFRMLQTNSFASVFIFLMISRFTTGNAGGKKSDCFNTRGLLFLLFKTYFRCSS
ncbi:hypothetical protein OWV82_005114 [Melia azedarach]|uniref:Uncharacterized protein n=1 Tax=Melia azedarach TaxID=155640 RepID=A0ACC1YTP0_MELAZ|nr:hypothetical protein OWV82_005114 [Melia azedarach]